jgi:hypothetical protein
MLTLAVQNTQLAFLHISLAGTLLSCAGLDVSSSEPPLDDSGQSREKLFWTLTYLTNVYGLCGRSLDVLTKIEKPAYVGSQQDHEQRSSCRPPTWPPEASAQRQSQSVGIWAFLIQLSALWKQVRTYVSHCAEGTTKTPWSVDSGYSIIAARLMDLETSVPTAYRYDFARFSDQSTDGLKENRDYWSPWLSIQFTYHAVHSMLNHPFLYSSRPQQSAQLAVPNTFWKTSSELALLHATWIVRLIDMVTEKSYHISDPFIGHCTAIAATTLIYFCTAADPRLKQASQSKVLVCNRFLSQLAERWPTCRAMHAKLQVLMRSAFPKEHQNGQRAPTRTKLSINSNVMWEILDYTRVSPRPYHQQHLGLFHESLAPTQSDTTADDDDDIEIQVFHNSIREVDTSDGGQAFPPFSDRVRTRRATDGNRKPDLPRRWDTPQAMEPDLGPPMINLLAADSEGLLVMPGAAAPLTSGGPSFMNMAYSPFMQFQDSDTSFAGMWEAGNL